MARRNRAVYKTYGGVKHKLCTGPGHREGKFVPLSNFFLRYDKPGVPRSQCKHCESIHQGSEQRVAYSEIKFAVNELIFRVGKAEAARRIGIKPATMWEWTKGRRDFIQRRKARAVITALAEARASNEARHKKSIRHGASLRGRKEKVPQRYQDFNGPNNTAAIHKREQRKELGEIYLERERQRYQKRTRVKSGSLTTAA